MKKELYILVNLKDDTGNDNGIRDKKELTLEESIELNNTLFENKSDCRWVLQNGVRNLYVTFYHPEYYS
jgi:hypothetical protein